MKEETRSRYQHFSRFIFVVGDFLREIHRHSDLGIRKKGTYDLVTEADTGSERMIVDEILRVYPHDSILGEELGCVQGNSEYRWILDPLDGTTNYSHNLPLYGISIALEEISLAKIVAGMVYFPELNDFYCALYGEGAFKNEKKIQVSQTNELKDSLFTTGFPYDRAASIDQLMAYYKNILLKTRGIRRTGAATLDLCWLAEGRFDGYYEIGLMPWDMAAGCLIVEEAGGRCTTFEGKPYSPYHPSLIATNGKLQEEVIRELNQ